MGYIGSKTRSLGQIIEEPMLVTKGCDLNPCSFFKATAHEAQVSNSRAIMALLLGTVDHVISLTLYNTIPTDMAFENSEGKEENAGN